MTVRFRIPKAVAAALYLDAIKRRARGRSVTDVRFDYEQRTSSHGEIRITCSTAMAIFLIEELRDLTERARIQRNHALVAECARAAAATIKAIDDGDQQTVVAIHPAASKPGFEHRA
jgi:hypothetical protein